MIVGQCQLNHFFQWDSPHLIRVNEAWSSHRINDLITKWLLEHIGMGNWGDYTLLEDSDLWHFGTFIGYPTIWFKDIRHKQAFAIFYTDLINGKFPTLQ